MGRSERVLLAHEAAALGMWELDVASGEVSVDERVAAMFGVRYGETPAVTAGFFDRIHPDDRADAFAAMRAAIDEGRSLETPYRVVWPDGTVRHLLSRGRAIPGAPRKTVTLIGAITDVTDMQEHAEARTRALRTRAGLVAVAQALGDVSLETEVLQVVTGLGARLLGAEGAVLTLRDRGDAHRPAPEHPLRVLTSDYFDVDHDEVVTLAADFPLPMVRVACTGRALHLPDRQAAVELFPDVAEMYERARTEASASLPLHAGQRLLGSLSIAWRGPRDFTSDDIDLLASFAALCAQALDRVQARAAEQAGARSVVSLAEALQRSLLSSPPQPDHLQIAVRYQPANEAAQIGGDWYDVFTTPDDDATCVVIGDVNGHDQTAAASMAQIRSLLRGIVYAGPDMAAAPWSPEAALAQLERTMTGLQVQALTTAVVAVVAHAPDVARPRRRLVRWCNAGHLTPMVRRHDGQVELLHTPPDLLLGVSDGTPRADHETWLGDRETLVLYTDGLVERRGEDIDLGVHRLQELLGELGDRTVDDLADQLLHRLVPGGGEDDVALVVVRVRPDITDREAEATRTTR